jgi:hypothetical protein
LLSVNAGADAAAARGGAPGADREWAGAPLTLKTPYRDGTTRVLFEPEDFMARLVALVPKPRAHLIRCHANKHQANHQFFPVALKHLLLHPKIYHPNPLIIIMRAKSY